jgi:DNA repair photolyase
MDGRSDFEGHIFVKVNAAEVLHAEVLHAELRRRSWERKPMTIGTIVDPYQPMEGRYRLTRTVLQELAAARTPATIITKNTMILRDLDVLQRLQARAGCTVFVSVTSLDAALLRRMEPGTPPPRKRLEAMRRLVEAGIPAGVIAAPLLPGITDGEASLAALATRAAASDARFFLAGALRLGEGIEPAFYPFLRRERPDLLPTYRRLYPNGYAPRAYMEALHARVVAIRAAYGLPASPPPLQPSEEPAQLSLAW